MLDAVPAGLFGTIERDVCFLKQGLAFCNSDSVADGRAHADSHGRCSWMSRKRGPRDGALNCIQPVDGGFQVAAR